MVEQQIGYKATSVSARVVLNVVSFWIASIVNGLIGLFLVPFLLQRLGREGYGIISLLGTIVAFTGVADMGIRTALGRHLAEEVAKNDVEGFNRVANTGLAVCGSIGLFCAAVCVSMAELLAGWFNVPAKMLSDSVSLIRWYGGSMILISFVVPVFGAVLTSNQRFDKLNYLLTTQRFMRGVGLIVVLSLTQAYLYGWALVTLSTEVLGLVLTVMLARRTWKKLTTHWKYLDRRSLVSLFSLGGYLFILQLTNLINSNSAPVILATLLGPAAIAFYSPSVSLSSAFRPLVFSLVYQLHPLSTDFHVTGRKAELHAILFRGTRYTLLMGIPVCVILGVFADSIMRAWIYKAMGADYKIVAQVLMLWALVDLIFYAQGTQWPVLLGMNRVKLLVVVAVPTTILSVVASILLVKYTNLGVLGVVVSGIVCSALARPAYDFYTARTVGVSYLKLFVQGYLRPLIVLLLLAGVAVAIREVSPVSLGSLVVCAVAVAICWLPLCWWVGFYPEDRRSFQSLMKKGLAWVGCARPTDKK